MTMCMGQCIANASSKGFKASQHNSHRLRLSQKHGQACGMARDPQGSQLGSAGFAISPLKHRQGHRFTRVARVGQAVEADFVVQPHAIDDRRLVDTRHIQQR